MSKKKEREFQIDKYWLSKRPNSEQWCRTWFERRQTQRASLGTNDLQIAKIKLAEWIVANRELRNERPQELALETVLVRYYLEYAKELPSAEQAKIALAKWSDFFAQDMVSDLTPKRQEEFIENLRHNGLSDGYISRVLSVGRAALNRSWKRQEITAVPFIMDTEKGTPRERRLSQNEVCGLLDAARSVPHIFTYIMIALNTLARPEAILDLTPFQIDLENRLIDLNPAGRKQTKKYRPVVPITDTLLPYVRNAGAARLVNYYGRPIGSIKTSFRAIVRRAELGPDVSPYTLRHTMATELRRRGVPPWEVSGFLGHQAGGYRTTEIYAKFDPSYLSAAARAIDGYFAELGIVTAPLRASCVLVGGGGRFQGIEKMVGATGIEPVTPTMST